MEQRPETPSPVVLGAGTDPTHIPGLETPESEGPETAAAESAEPSTPDTSSQREAPAHEDSDDEEPAVNPAEGDSGADEKAPPEGPSFEVFDHRSSIVADGNGVVFRLDDTEARFPWNEIGSVEIGASRFGRRFEVAVGTTDHRRFDAEVIASSKQKLQEWTTDLDAVLDTWFEDSEGS